MIGTYSILLKCSKRFRLKLGCLGYVNVKRGHYVYTGSALGKGSTSLEGRINRHRRRSKTIRWHIDYLTKRPEIHLEGSVYIYSRTRLECSINEALLEHLHGYPIARHAGASDCRCPAHLFLVAEPTDGDLINQLGRVYASFGRPIVDRYF
ncbi:MAG TPA: GIY-YIG nuclease family protein [Candidatus Acidoferrum sp.]|nr:GIY-YIG nuclease family protein [Candidatus Acidoferrum sp.]